MSFNQIDVEELVQGLKTGNEQCFNLLFMKYYQRIHFFAIQFVQSSDDAENLVQDTFILLWSNRVSLKAENEAGLLSWLYTVLKNNCYQHLKQLKARREFSTQLLKEQGELDMSGLADMDTSEQAISEINAIVENTLEKLTPQCRRVFVMSRFDCLKNKEIASLLSITEKAVERNMTRALKVFRVSLIEYLPVVLILL